MTEADSKDISETHEAKPKLEPSHSEETAEKKLLLRRDEVGYSACSQACEGFERQHS